MALRAWAHGESRDRNKAFPETVETIEQKAVAATEYGTVFFGDN